MRKPITLNDIDLEIICPVCNGNPPKTLIMNVIDMGPWCYKCLGLGLVLTEQGKAICTLISDHESTHFRN